ncbi:hypothetical protein ACFLTR_04690 [Chloroflexota bacterium]
MAGLKSLKKNSKVGITVEKWQERLISRWDTQGVSSAATEGESLALAQPQEVAQRTAPCHQRMAPVEVQRPRWRYRVLTLYRF